MALKGRLHPALEVDEPARFVDARDCVHHPIARGELPLGAVRVEAEDVAIAGALRAPQIAAVVEGREVVGEIDPGRRLLGEGDCGGARFRIHREQIEARLGAVLALREERGRVAGPVHAGEVDVGVRTEIDAHAFAGLDVEDPELDEHVCRTRAWVALFGDRHAVGADAEALDDFHRALVDAGDGEPAIVGRPPVAGAPIHLLLRDELGHSPTHEACAALGQCALAAGPQIVEPDILIADERHVATARADARVGFIALRCHEPARLTGAGVDVEHVAVQRHEERFAGFVPVVAHDAALGDARALAALNLRFGERALLWRQRAGVYESIGRARVDVHGPQIEGHAVFGFRAQEGDARAVRGETQGPRARPGEFRRTVDALDRED